MQSAPPESCSKCSAELPSGAVFCHRCGTPTPPTISGAGSMEYTPKSSGEDAKHRAELQRLLGDSCELRGLLGRGGFADVFEAWDPRLKRSLAVKTLRTDLVASVALVERFRREAEAIAQLRHPHVIPIYSVGGEGSVGYFVMPKVDGESLASLLAREKQLPVEESVRILREAASALSVAHRAGIVHRDVKPENILLDGPERRVLVMDFGIAKSLDSIEQGLTGTGMLVGTPQYMSPEQAAGDRGLDNRSDQYALATVGYRMITGQLPFDGDSAQAVIFKQVTEAARPIGELVPAVPADVAAVIERGLAKRPDDRFESMEAFDSALEKALRQMTTLKTRRARVPNMAARVDAMRRDLPAWKHPVVITALAGAIAGLVLAPRAVYRSAYELGARREDAVFAAKSFLATRGVSGSLDHIAEFRTKDTLSAYHFLLASIGGVAIEERATKDIPFWTWRVRLRAPAEKAPWVVDIGLGNRVVGYSRQVRDTTTGARLSAQEAEPLALQELTARGWTPASLRRLADSTIRRVNRTDHIFRWARPEGGIPWQAADTAYSMVTVVVRGSQVDGYSEYLESPRRFRQQHDQGQASALFGTLISVMVIVALVLGIGLLIARSRKDELQWGFGTRICLAVLAGVTPTILTVDLAKWLFGLPSSDTPAAIGLTDNAVPIVLLFSGLFLVVVIVESLSAEYRPEMLAGMSDLARGRLAVPELASAAAQGAIWGSLLVALQQLLALAGIAASGTHVSNGVFDLITLSMPAVDIPDNVSEGLAMTLLFAALQLAIFHFRRSGLVAVGGSIAIFAVITFLSPDTPMPSRVNSFVSITAASVVLWRFGLLAAVVVILVESTLAPLSLMFSIGASGGVGGSVLAAGTFVVPFALALYAYRLVVQMPLGSPPNNTR